VVKNRTSLTPEQNTLPKEDVLPGREGNVTYTVDTRPKSRSQTTRGKNSHRKKVNLQRGTVRETREVFYQTRKEKASGKILPLRSRRTKKTDQKKVDLIVRQEEKEGVSEARGGGTSTGLKESG